MADSGGAGKRWTRDETLAALSLYCQIPFGQMREGNARVIDLARQLMRTPASVGMKLANFASLDPFHAARGVGGLPNTSQLDREVWEEFYGRWEALADATPSALVEAVVEEDAAIPETERAALVVLRRGQQFFRNAVLSAYGGECCVTGITHGALLRASHIVPWKERKETRLDPANGLCLNALHDAAFDRGLITVGEDWTLKVSGRVRGVRPQETWQGFFARFDGAIVKRPERWEPAGEYLEWHRGRVFVAE